MLKSTMVVNGGDWVFYRTNTHGGGSEDRQQRSIAQRKELMKCSARIVYDSWDRGHLGRGALHRRKSSSTEPDFKLEAASNRSKQMMLAMRSSIIGVWQC
jgi:hypothetical protein